MMKLDELLLNWYDTHARSLPWRGSGDPYRIWLSEIMLQQTRAEAVVRYYERFLARFPNVHSLAQGELDEVLKLWEGLGYYSRARNLHAAARHISGEMNGEFPRTVEELEQLSGVGPYVARAVASIAWNVCAPALDGNQMRVLSRCFAVERILKTPFDLMPEAVQAISHSRPGDYNQALMDLGSAICTPKNPKCAACPLSPICQAYAEGEMERYPLRPAPVSKRDEDHTIFLIHTPNGVCIRRREEKKLLGGLYEFPSANGKLDSQAAMVFLSEAGYEGLHLLSPLPSAKHVFTHLIWHMSGWLLTAEKIPDGVQVADADQLRSRAFPSALRKYLEIALDIADGASDSKS